MTLRPSSGAGRQIRRELAGCLGLLLVVAVLVPPCPAADSSLGANFAALSEVVLEHHWDPPTRQAMLQAGLKAAYAAAERKAPAGMAREISDLQGPRALAHFLEERLAALPGDSPRAELTFLQGALSVVRLNQGLQTTDDAAVQQTLQENQYVGIGIALGRQNDYPVMMRVIPYGPAYVAGAKDRDVMLRIDDVDAQTMSLQQVVAKLRGQAGKPVEIEVQQPGGDKRLLNITRGRVPFPTIVGYQRNEDGSWDYRVEPTGRIAYLKLESIRGNVVAELREAARRIHPQGFQALILDLRSNTDGEPRHAAMLADQLLSGGSVGAVHRVSGRTQFQAKETQLFPQWPLVVLVDSRTLGQSAWLAAALQDRKRAVLAGAPSTGTATVIESFPVSDALGHLKIWTGVYERPNGKLMPAVSPLRLAADRFEDQVIRDNRSANLALQPDIAVPRPKQVLLRAVEMLQQRLGAVALRK